MWQDGIIENEERVLNRPLLHFQKTFRRGYITTYTGTYSSILWHQWWFRYTVIEFRALMSDVIPQKVWMLLLNNTLIPLTIPWQMIPLGTSRVNVYMGYRSALRVLSPFFMVSISTNECLTVLAFDAVTPRSGRTMLVAQIPLDELRENCAKCVNSSQLCYIWLWKNWQYMNMTIAMKPYQFTTRLVYLQWTHI